MSTGPNHIGCNICDHGDIYFAPVDQSGNFAPNCPIEPQKTGYRGANQFEMVQTIGRKTSLQMQQSNYPANLIDAELG